MKIVHISSFEGGGAGRAASRLSTGLNLCGQQSMLYVAVKSSDDPNVLAMTWQKDGVSRLRRRLRRFRLEFALRQRNTRSPADDPFSDDRTTLPTEMATQMPACDIVNLHWTAGFVDLPTFLPAISSATPVVWTLHDMNPFTGGCHYDQGCGKWQTECGACPQLNSTKTDDASMSIWRRKKSVIESIPQGRLHIVGPSRWVADCAKRSPILCRCPVSVIPNGIDLNSFRPIPRHVARQTLGIDPAAKVVLFVAANIESHRKGMRPLMGAVKSLRGIPKLLLCSVGAGDCAIDGVPHQHLGSFSKDEQMAIAYSSADAFVVPSFQDNLPNTIIESFACGTPVVAFGVGGIPEMVRPGVTGLLAPSGDIGLLRDAITRIFSDGELQSQMSAACRRVAEEEYSIELQARRYLALYSSMLSGKDTRSLE